MPQGTRPIRPPDRVQRSSILRTGEPLTWLLVPLAARLAEPDESPRSILPRALLRRMPRVERQHGGAQESGGAKPVRLAPPLIRAFAPPSPRSRGGEGRSTGNLPASALAPRSGGEGGPERSEGPGEGACSVSPFSSALPLSPPRRATMSRSSREITSSRCSISTSITGPSRPLTRSVSTRRTARCGSPIAGNGLVGVYKPNGTELYSFGSKKYLRDPVRIAVNPKGIWAAVVRGTNGVRLFSYRGEYKGDVAEGMGEKPVIGALAYDSEGNLYSARTAAARFRLHGGRAAEAAIRQPRTGRRPVPVHHRNHGRRRGDHLRQRCPGDRGAALRQSGQLSPRLGQARDGRANFSLPSGIAVDSRPSRL